jgi:DNA-binding NarL/FixJ family response regulator
MESRSRPDSIDHITEDLVLQITPWERAALQLLADGTPTSTLADRFQTSEPDLEARLTSLFARMGVAGPAEAISVALRRGLLTSQTA